eukprot:CAMPEP_0178422038 /NCGR_PEP_ID=MMETSP0689_2-20121128/26964_1 /TAXON_ID=160604 /ORGANISM="Amphidinium massartii, Strain CS-259" /LENGTH=79 /DNA_ID=CAMNT_0020043583 /DNA_START=260 /DNA_END=499 /DNA_ORIENTATION=+
MCGTDPSDGYLSSSEEELVRLPCDPESASKCSAIVVLKASCKPPSSALLFDQLSAGGEDGLERMSNAPAGLKEAPPAED